MSWVHTLQMALRARLLELAPETNREIRAAVPTLPTPIALAKVQDGARVRVRARIVAPDDPLYAPLTGRPCVFWSLTIEAGQALGPWRSRLRDSSGRPFDVEDETGRASIDVRGMHAFAISDAIGGGAAIHEIVERYDSEDAPLRRRNAPELRVREGILEAGEVIFLQGRARWTDGPFGAGPDYRSSARERHLVIGPDDDEPVYASDDENGPY